MTPKLSKPVFGFERALKLMKRGRKVARYGEGLGFLKVERNPFPTDAEWVFARIRGDREAAGVEIAETMQCDDLLATDWYEVDPPKYGRSKKPIRPGRTDKPAT